MLNLQCSSEISMGNYYYNSSSCCVVYNKYTRINLFRGKKEDLFSLLHEQGHHKHFTSLSRKRQERFMNVARFCNAYGNIPELLMYEIIAWKYAFKCVKISEHKELENFALKCFKGHVLYSNEREDVDHWLKRAKETWKRYRRLQK